MAIIKAKEAVKGAFPHKEFEVNNRIKEGEQLIVADDFLGDLFFNVMHNAMKHSKDDSVRIDVEAHSSTDNDYTEIHISDYGPGIPDEEKKRILQRRLGAKGSGIGLTILNYLLDRYGGYVQIKNRVEDDQSQGSKFILILKRATHD